MTKKKKTTNVQGYYYDNEKKKFRVRLTVNGFRYGGGHFENETDALKAVKKLSESIKNGTAIPNAISPTTGNLNQVRQEIINDIKKANGIFTVKNQDELIESLLKDSPKYKESQKRLAEAKKLKFEPDSDPEVEPTTLTTVVPAKQEPMQKIEGLDILNTLAKPGKVEESKFTLTSNELEQIVASAVKKALSEALNGIQGNKRTGR